MSIRFVSWLTGLTAKATLAGTEELYINDGGTSKKVVASAFTDASAASAAAAAASAAQAKTYANLILMGF